MPKGVKPMLKENAEGLWTIQDVAAHFGVAVTTIYGWRVRNEGPRGIRVGGQVRFRPSDVRAWEEERADKRARDRAVSHAT
jgi:excisionase family DNA binding protein